MAFTYVIKIFSSIVDSVRSLCSNKWSKQLEEWSRQSYEELCEIEKEILSENDPDKLIRFMTVFDPKKKDYEQECETYKKTYQNLPFDELVKRKEQLDINGLNYKEIKVVNDLWRSKTDVIQTTLNNNIKEESKKETEEMLSSNIQNQAFRDEFITQGGRIGLVAGAIACAGPPLLLSTSANMLAASVVTGAALGEEAGQYLAREYGPKTIEESQEFAKKWQGYRNYLPVFK